MAWMVLLAVIALPVVEIALFIKSAHWLGLLPTIVLAVGAGFAGIAMVRAQGLDLLLRARSQMDRGEVPVREVFDGICLAVAGALLVLPGFFTDFIAIALLLPPVRAALRLWLVGRKGVVVAAARPGAHPETRSSGPQVIEADYHVVDDNDRPKP
jgi:UPF0716 protein FxsA